MEVERAAGRPCVCGCERMRGCRTSAQGDARDCLTFVCVCGASVCMRMCGCMCVHVNRCPLNYIPTRCAFCCDQSMGCDKQTSETTRQQS